MLLLPHGADHQELLGIRLEPPDLIDRLRLAGLTGFARFTFDGAQAILLFLAGRLAEALFETPTERHYDLAALQRTFARCAAERGRLGVGRLAPEVAAFVHDLLHGEPLFAGRELAGMDVKALLRDLRASRTTGALQVHASERSGLILFRDGAPLGFLHDGAGGFSTTVAGYQKIAGLPGARIDGWSATPAARSELDLQQVIDLRRLWSRYRSQYLSGPAGAGPPQAAPAPAEAGALTPA